MGPLPRARPVSVLPPNFLEDRCVRGNVERSSISVEGYPRSLFRGVAGAVALPDCRSGKVIAPGLDVMVREALLLMTMVTGCSLRFLYRYSGQLLAIVSLDTNCASIEISSFVPIIFQVKSTVDKNAVDARSLLRAVYGRAICSVANYFLFYACYALSSALNRHSRQYYSNHAFHAMARLDVPTWDDPAVASQINALFPRSHNAVSWAVILTFVNTASAVLRMLSQSAVLFGVLRGQKDGLLFALLTLASEFLYYLSYSNTYPLSRSK
jgi:hypothetical protein